jgi:hypothetical protein
MMRQDIDLGSDRQAAKAICSWGSPNQHVPTINPIFFRPNRFITTDFHCPIPYSVLLESRLSSPVHKKREPHAERECRRSVEEMLGI